MTDADTIVFDISICPTAMERDGDILDEYALLARIREVATGKWGDGVEFATLQVGHNQGDEWSKSWKNGQRDDSLAETLMVELVDWTDEDLYAELGKDGD